MTKGRRHDHNEVNSGSGAAAPSEYCVILYKGDGDGAIKNIPFHSFPFLISPFFSR